MKKPSLIIVVVLAIALIGESVYLFQQISTQQKLSFQQTGLQQKISDLEKEKTALGNDKSQLQVEVGKLTQENKTLSDNISKLDGQIKTASDSVVSLTKSVGEKDSSIDQLKTQNSALTSKFMCKDKLDNVDFSSNDAVSARLASYVNSTKISDDPVSAHYWNLVWSDSKYSIHTVEVYSPKNHVNYVWKFTVYYNGEADGTQVNGIFYNDAQCWLYLNK